MSVFVFVAYVVGVLGLVALLVGAVVVPWSEVTGPPVWARSVRGAAPGTSEGRPSHQPTGALVGSGPAA